VTVVGCSRIGMTASRNGGRTGASTGPDLSGGQRSAARRQVDPRPARTTRAKATAFRAPACERCVEQADRAWRKPPTAAALADRKPRTTSRQAANAGSSTVSAARSASPLGAMTAAGSRSSTTTPAAATPHAVRKAGRGQVGGPVARIPAGPPSINVSPMAPSSTRSRSTWERAQTSCSSRPPQSTRESARPEAGGEPMWTSTRSGARRAVAATQRSAVPPASHPETDPRSRQSPGHRRTTACIMCSRPSEDSPRLLPARRAALNRTAVPILERTRHRIPMGQRT
jgi:hypothetical protein